MKARFSIKIQMALEDKLMSLVTVKVISKMDFLMVMENSFGMMELFKKEDGKKVISKDQAEIQKCLIIY
jgi:hypothetical protein